jgi:hypothetical protein
MYEKRVDLIRKLVAFAFGICGLGLVICANQAQFATRRTDAWEVGALASGIGMLAFLAATVALVIEGIGRLVWLKGKQTKFQFRLRTLLILMTLFAVILGFFAVVVKGYH